MVVKSRFRVPIMSRKSVFFVLGPVLLILSVSTGWWWIAWPDRTAREFAKLISQGDFESASNLLLPPSKWTVYPNGETAIENAGRDVFPAGTEAWKDCFKKPLKLKRRGLSDIFASRRTFGLHKHLFLDPIQFTVDRGRIRYEWIDLDYEWFDFDAEWIHDSPND